jgi:transposase
MSRDKLVLQMAQWVKEGLEVHCVQESCGFGFVLHRLLSAAGAHSIVITPIRLNERGTPRKTDKLDARALCLRLSRFLDGNQEELNPIRIPTQEEQHSREVTRRREFFRREIGRLDNRGHPLVMEYMHQPLEKGWWGPRKWKRLCPQLDPWVRERLGELRDLIVPFHEKVKTLTQELEQRLVGQEIPRGLGALTLAVLDAEVCEWNRFHNRKAVGSYTGCCPGVYGSGGKQRYGSIDHCGNPRVRRQLVEAVWRFLQWQPDWHMRKKFLARLTDSKAQRKKVVVALARALAVDLWRWRTGQCTLEDLGLIGKKVE